MFTKKEIPKYQKMLEGELESAIRNLRSHVTGSKDYADVLSSVERLHGMLPEDKQSRISADTRATLAANLIGILMIIKHERVNVITSKALGFVIRPR